MKLLFADETEKQASAAQRSFFCICGLSVDSEEAIPLSNELEEIKLKYGLTNLKEARTKGLTEDVRLAITKEVHASLDAHGAKVIGVVLGDISLSYGSPPEDIYMGAMTFLLERFAIPLMKKGGFGLVTFDSVGKPLDSELRKKFYEYVRTEVVQMSYSDTPIGAFRNHIYPSLAFAKDDHSVLIQAVDLIAVSLNNAIVNTQKVEKTIVVDGLPSRNQFLNIYWPLFERSPQGKVEGWGIKVWY